MRFRGRILKLIGCCACWVALGLSTAAAAQSVLDRVDPSRVERAVRPDRAPDPRKPVIDAERSRPDISQDGRAFTIGAIYLDGLKALRQADFADIFGRYVGRTVGPAELGELADAIAGRARDRGYVFATASIPPQALEAGMLKVEVDEGRIDDVRLSGYDSAAVRRGLLPLVGDQPVRLAELERRLLIAGDVDGVVVRRTRLVREGRRNVLVADVSRDRFAAAVGIANDGSRPIGPVQADLRLRASQLLSSDDTLSFTGLITPFQPNELQYGALRYAQRISPAGTELFVNGSASAAHPGAYLRGLDIDGRSWAAGGGLLQPLFRQRAASLWAELSVGVRRVEQDRQDVRVRRDRLSTARLSLYGSAAALGGRLRSGATLSQGLDIFDATRPGDPLASRLDADGAFASAYFWADWTGKVAGKLEARVAAASQVASGPLLVSEEVGLGGGAFLRAYDYSERSGDEGAMASAELRRAFSIDGKAVRRIEIYAFVDGGRVTNKRGGFGSGSLASTGGGFRATLAGGVSADVALAIPLSGPRYDSGDSKPTVLFRLSKSF